MDDAVSSVQAIAGSRAELRQRLDAAEIVPLTMSLVHVTGEESWLEEIKPYVRGAWEHQIAVPDTLAARIRDRMAAELGRSDQTRDLAPTVIHRMMCVAAGEEVDNKYLPLVLEQLFNSGKSLSSHASTEQEPCAGPPAFRVLIIGAGASGLCAAIRLEQCNVPYMVLEKNDDVGGTWFENRYPGCAVDLPSHYYEYSFEPNQDWPHYYSRQPSVLEYLSRCADKYNVRRNFRFGLEVRSAAYDEKRQLWTVQATSPNGSSERFEANAVITAVGQLNRPLIPKIPGLDRFKGQSFHTAAWPAGLDLRGRRVALIGTGPSAVQVGPAIADEVTALHIFQRSGSWVARRPNVNRPVTGDTKWVLHHVPFYAQWYRFQLFWAFGDGLLEAFKIDPMWSGAGSAISQINAKHRAAMVRYIERELAGREDLLEKVLPKYPAFAKRVIADPGWYRMLKKPNVMLINTPIERVEEQGIRTGEGTFVEIDTIIFATGFRADRMLWPMEVYGRNGIDLRSIWNVDDPRAYLGITVPEFPNFFMLYGPNSNFAHGGSAIFMAECQVNYIVRLLDTMARHKYRAIEVRKAVHDRYNSLIDEELKRFSWNHPSVKSWYRNAAGRIVTNQPWRLVDYWHMTRGPVAADYEFERVPTRAVLGKG